MNYPIVENENLVKQYECLKVSDVLPDYNISIFYGFM